MIDKEKVRELAVKLSREESYNVKIITEWLEKNQPEPVVVGLSDEQIALFDEFVIEHCDINFIGTYLRDWQKTQAFDMPYDVEVMRTVSDCNKRFADYIKENAHTLKPKEIPVGLSDEQVGELAEVVAGVDNIARLENRIRGWLMTQTCAQPQVKEIPVGLSDVQTELLARKIMSRSVTRTVKEVIEEFLKTQTFEQPNQFPQFDEKCKEIGLLTNEIEQLKSQSKFQPDWNSEPEWCTKATLQFAFYGINGNEYKVLDIAEFERPKPTPQVEVGQVWNGECLGSVVVKDIIWLINGETKVKREVVILEVGTDYYHYDRPDFLAKFEQIGA